MISLAVNEMFGPTLQGEGPSAGRRAWFLRLAGCNLRCTWCDTPQTWDGTRFDLRAETTRMTLTEVASRLDPTREDLLVITGGEPLLQADNLTLLVNSFDDVEVETNGTLPPPTWPWARFNVSPKLPNSGTRSSLHPDWIGDERARFKFVVTCPADLDLVDEYGTEASLTWIMPEGQDADTTLAVARAVADDVIARGWNLTMRQHILLWGSERGR